MQKASKQSKLDGHTVEPGIMQQLQQAFERLREPGFHLQHAIESWSNFLILPLFAFFNMGVVLVGVSFDFYAPESIGVLAGLAFGKPLGILLFCWLATRFGIARLPFGVSWMQMFGAGCLAGVGFTMSIFIATAAFEGEQLKSVKPSILVTSVIAASIGMIILAISPSNAYANQQSDSN